MRPLRGFAFALLALIAAALVFGALPPAHVETAQVAQTRATRILANFEALGLDLGPRARDAATTAMLREIQRQSRYTHEWIFDAHDSRHELTPHAGGAAAQRVVLVAHGAERFTVIAPSTRQYVDVDGARLLEELSGQPGGDERYRVESIGVETGAESKVLAGKRARRSTITLTMVATDALIGLQLRRKVVAIVWHTRALPAAGGLDFISLVAGIDARAVLRDTLQREHLDFPLLIEVRVHDWSGDGVRPDPGSFRWRVTSVETASIEKRLFKAPRTFAQVARLPLPIAPIDASPRASATPPLPSS